MFRRNFERELVEEESCNKTILLKDPSCSPLNACVHSTHALICPLTESHAHTHIHAGTHEQNRNPDPIEKKFSIPQRSKKIQSERNYQGAQNQNFHNTLPPTLTQLLIGMSHCLDRYFRGLWWRDAWWMPPALPAQCLADPPRLFFLVVHEVGSPSLWLWPSPAEPSPPPGAHISRRTAVGCPKQPMGNTTVL